MSAKLTAFTPTPTQRRRVSVKQWMVGYLFVLPALIFTIIFEYYPMLGGIIRSFYRWNGVNIQTFIGFGNFIAIFSDPVFWTSMGNMLFFLAFNLILMVPTIVVCIVLFRIKHAKLQYLYRVLFCIPAIIPGIVTLLLWEFMYNPQYGFFNQFLSALGLQQQLWLGDPHLVKWCILLMGIPWVGTISALIYLGGLQSIDSSVWDAALIDGVGPIRRAWSIELPLLKGQFKLNLVGVLAGTVTGYGTQLVLTNGGPGFSSLVPGLYMYQHAFDGQTEFGYASAVGLVLFAISLLISLFAMKYIRSEG